MRISLRMAAFRVALTGMLVLFGSSTKTQAATPPEKIFPESTVFFAKAGNVSALREAFKQTQYGQLLADPALKPLRDDVKAKLEERSAELKGIIGVGLEDLIEIPQGPVTLAVLPKNDADIPAALVLTVDAGKNAEKLASVLTKATEHGSTVGTKVDKEEFKGLTLYVITPPKPKAPKEAKADKDDKDAKAEQRAPTPITWAKQGNLFYIGTDTEVLKDVIANAEGRTDSLAESKTYLDTLKKLDAENQVLWYSDLRNFFKLVKKTAAQGKNAANVDQFEAMIPIFGLNSLKAAAGSLNLNSGNLDTVAKTFVLLPKPLKGLLKALALPKISLKPEPWVPATASSYQSFSWDLDAAFAAINDLANTFQPGVINILEQQLVGANGGEPLNFKKDIFDPLGDRISVVTDYKQPVSENSQRILLSIALEDPKTFERTLQKLISLAGAPPKKRLFKTSTIYEFEAPEIPNGADGELGNIKTPPTISVSLVQNAILISTEATALEQVIQGGTKPLAESPAFLEVSKEIPGPVSALTYVRPDESAKVTYEMFKSGQFEKALQGANVAGAPDFSKLPDLIDLKRLPSFKVVAKYLTHGGGFAILDDEGVSITNFTLHKANP